MAGFMDDISRTYQDMLTKAEGGARASISIAWAIPPLASVTRWGLTTI